MVVYPKSSNKKNPFTNPEPNMSTESGAVHASSKPEPIVIKSSSYSKYKTSGSSSSSSGSSSNDMSTAPTVENLDKMKAASIGDAASNDKTTGAPSAVRVDEAGDGWTSLGGVDAGGMPAKSWEEYQAEGYKDFDDLVSAGIAIPTVGDGAFKEAAEYYGPVVSLALWQSGAFDLAAKSASAAWSKIANSLTKTPKVGWADEVVEKAGSVSPNKKTYEYVRYGLKSILKKYKKPLVALSALTAFVTTAAWNGHLQFDNVVGSYEIAMRDALIADNPDAYNLAREGLTTFADEGVMNEVVDWVPGLNILKTTIKDGTDQIGTTIDVYDLLYEDLMSEEDEDAIYAQRRQDETDAQAARVDYFR